MGVHGLWGLVSGCARNVTTESLSEKKLAVDASIWLYQFLKAIQNRQSRQSKEGDENQLGQALGLFLRRLCKLLFLRIFPVFVFDGIAPNLKYNTLASRRNRKNEAQQRLVDAKMKVHALQSQVPETQQIKSSTELVQSEISFTTTTTKGRSRGIRRSVPKKRKFDSSNDLFELPPSPNFRLSESGSEDENELIAELMEDLPPIQDPLRETNFDEGLLHSLPARVHLEIASELQSISRETSWKRLREMKTKAPTASDFSLLQIQNTVKRNDLTRKLDQARNRVNLENSKNGIEVHRVISEEKREYFLLERNESQLQTLSNEEINSTNGQEEGKGEDDWEDIDVPLDSKQLFSPIKQDQQNETQEKEDDDIWEDIENEEVDILKTQNNKIDISIKIDESATSQTELEFFASLKKSSQMINNVSKSQSPKSKEKIQEKSQEKSQEKYQEKEKILTQSDIWIESEEGKKCKKCDPKLFQKMKSFEKLSLLPLKEALVSLIKEKFLYEINDPKKEATEFLISFVEDLIVNWNERPQPQPSSLPPLLPQKTQRKEKTFLQKKKEQETLTSVHSIVRKKKSLEVIDIRVEEPQKPPMVKEKFIEEEKTTRKEKGKKDNESIKNIFDLEDDLESDMSENDWDDYDKIELYSKLPPSSKSNEDQRKIDKGKQKQIEVIEPKQKEALQVEDLDEDDEELQEALLLSLQTQENSKDSQDSQSQSQKNNNTSKIKLLKNTVPPSLSELQKQNQSAQRDLSSPNTQLLEDVKELLSLFGVPYIDAPSEAEAQCCFLEQHQLVDGIVTEDSDCLLFGAKTIYKSLFNQNKPIECYLTRDIEMELGLTRVDFIDIAYFVGSDYTEGIEGIGVVTALEIVNHFKKISLTNGNKDDPAVLFAEWWKKFQQTKDLKDEAHKDLAKKLKSKVDKIFLRNDFPDPRVKDAYINPLLDHSIEPFSFALPHLQGIRNFMKAKASWSQDKTDDIVLPIIRKMNESEGQQSILSFFSAVPKNQEQEKDRNQVDVDQGEEKDNYQVPTEQGIRSLTRREDTQVNNKEDDLGSDSETSFESTVTSFSDSD